MVRLIAADHLVKYEPVMVAKPPMSPRANRTRDALIVAGLDLLAERPIDAIPIDDVVRRAGVAKGSFFNHFSDKNAFAAAISKAVRQELENLVATANATVTDPVERIAGGMRVGLEFAMHQPKRSQALMRSLGAASLKDHPLNRGLLEDLERAAAAGLLRPEALRMGVPYWLALNQVLMQTALNRKAPDEAPRQRLADMLVLGLTGLGVQAERARAVALSAAELLCKDA